MVNEMVYLLLFYFSFLQSLCSTKSRVIVKKKKLFYIGGKSDHILTKEESE